MSEAGYVKDESFPEKYFGPTIQMNKKREAGTSLICPVTYLLPSEGISEEQEAKFWEYFGNFSTGKDKLPSDLTFDLITGIVLQHSYIVAEMFRSRRDGSSEGDTENGSTATTGCNRAVFFLLVHQLDHPFRIVLADHLHAFLCGNGLVGYDDLGFTFCGGQFCCHHFEEGVDIDHLGDMEVVSDEIHVRVSGHMGGTVSCHVEPDKFFCFKVYTEKVGKCTAAVYSVS